jgi:hypothetical protein
LHVLAVYGKWTATAEDTESTTAEDTVSMSREDTESVVKSMTQRDPLKNGHDAGK